jgi:hypothetical protein
MYQICVGKGSLKMETDTHIPGVIQLLGVRMRLIRGSKDRYEPTNDVVLP